jgi:hypothetical protein
MHSPSIFLLKFFRELEKTICKFMWNNKKKKRIVKTIFNNKRISGGISISDLKLYYGTLVKKILHHICTEKGRKIKNRIEDSEIIPHSYGHLIFNKGY